MAPWMIIFLYKQVLLHFHDSSKECILFDPDEYRRPLARKKPLRWFVVGLRNWSDPGPESLAGENSFEAKETRSY